MSPSNAFRQPFEQLHDLLNYLVPPHASRIPLALSNAYVLLLPSLLLLLMASLARVRDTWPLRMGLLPLTMTVTLRVYFGYYCDDPELVGANHGLGELFDC